MLLPVQAMRAAHSDGSLAGAIRDSRRWRWRRRAMRKGHDPGRHGGRWGRGLQSTRVRVYNRGDSELEGRRGLVRTYDALARRTVNQPGPTECRHPATLLGNQHWRMGWLWLGCRSCVWMLAGWMDGWTMEGLGRLLKGSVVGVDGLGRLSICVIVGDPFFFANLGAHVHCMR